MRGQIVLVMSLVATILFMQRSRATAYRAAHDHRG